MSMPGCQWGYIEPRCASRAVRVLGKVPQASGDLYDDSTHSDNDGGHRENNGRTAFGACPGCESDQTGAVQYVHSLTYTLLLA